LETEHSGITPQRTHPSSYIQCLLGRDF